MKRAAFHDFFNSSAPIILPVIHVISETQTAINIDKLIDAGIKGCFLINHDFDVILYDLYVIIYDFHAHNHVFLYKHYHPLVM